MLLFIVTKNSIIDVCDKVLNTPLIPTVISNFSSEQLLASVLYDTLHAFGKWTIRTPDVLNHIEKI